MRTSARPFAIRFAIRVVNPLKCGSAPVMRGADPHFAGLTTRIVVGAPRCAEEPGAPGGHDPVMDA